MVVKALEETIALRETLRRVVADLAPIVVAFATFLAVVARKCGLDGDMVPKLQILDIRSDFDHGSASFVTND